MPWPFTYYDNYRLLYQNQLFYNRVMNHDTLLIPGEGLMQFRMPARSVLYTSDQKLDVVR
jgi:hypothetical protein